MEGPRERRELTDTKKLTPGGRITSKLKHRRDRREDWLVSDLGLSGMKQTNLRICNHKAALAQVH